MWDPAARLGLSRRSIGLPRPLSSPGPFASPQNPPDQGCPAFHHLTLANLDPLLGGPSFLRLYLCVLTCPLGLLS